MKLRRKPFLSILFAVVMTALLTVSAFAKPTLNKKKTTINAGQSVTLKVKGTKQKPKWSSSNKKIATVSKKGVVTGRSAGNVIIKAKVGGKTLKCKVTVIAPANTSTNNTGSTEGNTNTTSPGSTGNNTTTPGTTGDNTNSPISIDPTNGFGGGVFFTVRMKSYDFLAQFAVQLHDKVEQKDILIYSSTLIYGQEDKLGIDTGRYEILRVGILLYGEVTPRLFDYSELDEAKFFTISGDSNDPKLACQKEPFE